MAICTRSTHSSRDKCTYNKDNRSPGASFTSKASHDEQFRLLHHLRTSLWPVLVLCVLFGIALSFATATLDDGTLVPLRFSGGPDAALAILGAIAASMITLAGIVPTIVLVVVHLAMGQFSPRIVCAVLHDRPSQWTIGIFVVAFAHAMLTMRAVDSTEQGAPVPGLAIFVAFGPVVASIVVLNLYVNHIGQSLRAAALIETVGKEMREVLEVIYRDHGSAPNANSPDTVLAPHSGVIFRVSYDQLTDAARKADCALEMLPSHGDFVPAGAPLFQVKGNAERLDHADATAAVALGPERTRIRT